MSDRAAKPGKDHILIVGPGKTGTTGLYASIKRGLQQFGVQAVSVFEPPNSAPIDNLFTLAPGMPVLVKTTMDSAKQTVPDPQVYDRRVMTVRDPRDVVISSLLFRPLTVASLRRTDDRVIEEFVRGLEAKQADPSAVSVRDLFDLAERLQIGSSPFASQVKNLRAQRDFMAKYPVHLMHYERFVVGDLGDLSSYLGFEVENVSASESSMFGHISRSQASGEFKQWFRADDLEYFNEMFAEHLAAFDYPLDAELAASPTIAPETGSEYVRSRYAQRRANLTRAAAARGSEWTPESVDSIESLNRLIDYGSDGDSSACVRVAEVLIGGHLGPAVGDASDALNWARAGARLGNPRGIALTIRLLRKAAGDDAELHRELRRWMTYDAMRRSRRSADDKAQIAGLENELKSLRESTKLRVGDHLVEAARNPRRNGRAAVKELRSLWRERKRLS